jgi:hypothetical protein
VAFREVPTDWTASTDDGCDGTQGIALHHQVKTRFVVTFAEYPAPDLPKGP